MTTPQSKLVACAAATGNEPLLLYCLHRTFGRMGDATRNFGIR